MDQFNAILQGGVYFIGLIISQHAHTFSFNIKQTIFE